MFGVSRDRGVEVDTVEMVLRLPSGKLRELRELVEQWLGRKSCSLQELQSVAAKLQHACKVVVPRCQAEHSSGGYSI